MHTSSILAQERPEVLREFFSMAPEKPEKALPSAEVRFSISTTIHLLQRPRVFSTSSASFWAPGSTPEAAPSWKQQHDPVQLPAPALCPCIVGTSVSSCFRGASAKQKGLTLSVPGQPPGFPYQWLLLLVSEPAALKPATGKLSYIL